MRVSFLSYVYVLTQIITKVMNSKPHAVFVPAPFQGHVKPMLQLAKLLYNKGFHITFVLVGTTRESLLGSWGPNSLAGSPGFRFEALSEDFKFLDDLEHTPVDVMTLLAPFRDLVSKLNDEGATTSDVPRVSCIVSDGLMFFTMVVGREVGVPVGVFSGGSACAFMGTCCLSSLRDKGLIPLRDESCLKNGYMDTVIDCIPGMKDMRLKDLPSFIRTTNHDDAWLALAIQEAEKRSEASVVVLNTFHALEQDVLEALASTLAPRVHTIGPLQMLLHNFPLDPLDRSLLGYSLFKEDGECLQWLEPRPPGSVVYVNFGSLAVLTREQVLELGWGLANSGHPFLWVIRPGLVIDREEKGENIVPLSLPREFGEEIRERGMVTSWCPQERVLGHSAVGGFLTHCGWNSTLESISVGIPMLCKPFSADQPTNCRYSCKEWGIGMEIESDFKRNEVEKMVREMMEEEKGKEMRKNAMKWKRKAEEATSVNGSSAIALDNLVKALLSKQ